MEYGDNDTLATEQHIEDDVGGPILKSKGQNAADIFSN